MSEERFEQDELKDEDVEAHKKHSMARDTSRPAMSSARRSRRRGSDSQASMARNTRGHR